MLHTTTPDVNLGGHEEGRSSRQLADLLSRPARLRLFTSDNALLYPNLRTCRRPLRPFLWRVSLSIAEMALPSLIEGLKDAIP